MEVWLLTTEDNPYNPFDDFDHWLSFDVTKGYFTCERLASFAHTSDSLSEEENNEEIKDAIKRLIEIGVVDKYGHEGRYKIVRKEL